MHRSLAVLVAFLLGACADSATDPGTGPVAPESRGSYPPTHADVWTAGPPQISPPAEASFSMLAACGPTAESALVHNGTQVGSVRVANDPSGIHITFRMTAEGWYISNTLLSISPSPYGIYRDAAGRASPWAFSRQANHWPVVQEQTITIPYTEYSVGAGETLSVVAVAGAVHPMTSDWNGPWEWLLLWGSGTPVHASYPAETYGTYTVQTCPGGGPFLERRGAIAITFDDGWSSTHDVAFPILRERGLIGNAAVNPAAVDGLWTGYMHLPELRTLHEAGWSIVSHSWSHPNLVYVTDSQLERELVDTKAWIEKHGFRGSDVFIVPYHSWGPREIDAVRRHYGAARGFSVNQFWPDRMLAWPPSDPYALTGYEPEYAPYTTVEGREKVRAFLERATREGRFVDFFFHDVPAEDAPEFGEMMNIFQRYRSVVRPYHELFP